MRARAAPARTRAAARGRRPIAATGASSGPSDEEQPGARLPPRHEQPGGGERGVEEREPERDVAEREEGHREREREPRPLPVQGRRSGERREAERPAAGIERQGCGRPAGEEGGETGRGCARRRRRAAEARSRAARPSRPTAAPRSARASSGAGGRLAGLVESALSTSRRSRLGSSGRSSPSGRAPASIARAVSSIEPRQNGCRPASASHSITPTAQTSAAGVASLPASRSGEMYASVPGTSPCLGQRLGLGHHAGEPEVEHARRHALAVGKQHVRRLDVAVEDSGRVGVGEAVADLRARLDRRLVRETAFAQRLAERAARHELVGDVDMARVAREAVRAQAGRMPEMRGRRRLALGARRGLSLPGDDLEGDLEPRSLVAREPDRARPAAAQRPQRPVAVEDEIGGGERGGGLSHALRRLATRVGLSFPAPVRLARE